MECALSSVGVFQCSVLRPLLFIAYSTDLPDACKTNHTHCSQFADDMILISSHLSASVAERELQLVVTGALECWCKWCLLVYESKAVVMSIQSVWKKNSRVYSRAAFAHVFALVCDCHAIWTCLQASSRVKAPVTSMRGVQRSVWQTSGGSTPNRPENPTVLVESPLETMKPIWIGIIYVCRSLLPKLY